MELSCIPVSLFPQLLSGELSIAQWARLGAELGLDAIDVSILFLNSRGQAYLRAVAKSIRQNGVRLAIVNTYSDLTHPDAGERARQNADLLSDIDAAAELGASTVRITAGQAHPALETGEAVKWVLDGFHRAAEQADKRGITLAYENHSKPGVWRYWDFSHPTEVFLTIAEGIVDTSIGILFDTANAIVSGNDPLLLLEKVIPRVICVHAADTGNKGQLNPVLVGSGVVPFRSIFGFLQAKGFKGVISIEEASRLGGRWTPQGGPFHQDNLAGDIIRANQGGSIMKEGSKAGGLRILSEEKIRAIHEAGLSLLDKPGIFCESRLILDIFKKSSAIVDDTKGIIRLDRSMVEAALKTAPKSFIMHGSDPQMDILVKTGLVYYGMGGTSEPFFYDYGLGHSRKPTRKDMEAATRIGQQLTNIDFIMTLCTSGDVPVGQAFYHDLATILQNTSKPVVFTMLDRQYATKIIELACAAGGGEAEFKKRPNLLALVCPVSPLVFPKIAEGIIDTVQYGLPVLYSPGPMLSGTGPATLAGLLAQTIAEILFGLVLTQLIRPGAPIIFKMDSDVMDPATGQCTYGSPEQVLGRSALAQFGYFYDIPTFTMAGGVESKLPDSEAAAEAMMGMLMNGLAGITMNQSQGTMASGLYGSVEQLVICDEMIHMIKRVLRGFEVNDDTLALEVIRTVGPGGSFLMEDHTLGHFRGESFFPVLFRRQSIDEWLTRGGKPVALMAHERVEEILAQEKKKILSPQRQQALEKALAKAVSGLE